jgi:hypothetical protein
MLSVQEGVVCHVDEELAAVGVRSRVRHRDGSDNVAQALSELISKHVARSASTPHRSLALLLGKWVSSLNHKAIDHSMESLTVIESLSCKLDEVSHCPWRLFQFKLKRELAVISNERSGTRIRIQSFFRICNYIRPCLF